MSLFCPLTSRRYLNITALARVDCYSCLLRYACHCLLVDLLLMALFSSICKSLSIHLHDLVIFGELVKIPDRYLGKPGESTQHAFPFASTKMPIHTLLQNCSNRTDLVPMLARLCICTMVAAMPCDVSLG